MTQPEMEPAAIVAMACVYPGAQNPAQLWDAVLHQRTAFRRIPSGRLPLNEYGPLSGLPSNDTLYVESAGLIEGWSFDIERYRVPRNLYEAADLTHWLTLDTVSQLLTSLATPDGMGLPRETTGVILGNSMAGETSRSNALRLRWPYVVRALQHAAKDASLDLAPEFIAQFEAEFKSGFPEPGDETLAGGLANTIAGRICNYFDFHGTGYTIDGACSSSLLAVMTGLNALTQGSLDFVICGGVDISIDPFEMVGFSRLNALSQGAMRVYDEHPTGFLPGEGCGLVAMMRHDDAVRAGFPIRAILHSVGTSSDGAGGLTRPDRDGHLRAARRAYEQASIDPRSVEMFEGHGTGTRVGDPLEIEVFHALKKGADTPAAFGSIKANIGHTKAAAGIAGLIKAVSAVETAILPPATGIVSPLPTARQSAELLVLREPRSWDSQTRIAGISAMGFGGINTHAVITNAPVSLGTHRRGAVVPLSARTGPYEVWIVSAGTAEGLMTRLIELAQRVQIASDAECGSIALDIASRDNADCRYRAAFMANTVQTVSKGLSEAERLLAACINDEGARPIMANDAGTCFVRAGREVRIGLLFPGQAAPIIKTGTILEHISHSSPVLDAARNGLRGLAGANLSDTSAAQLAIVSASLLGMAWLDSLGVRAHTAMGHSLGEISTLAWAGVLDPAAAVQLAQRRGACMSRFGMAGTGMISVAADASRTEEFIREFGAAASDQPLVVAAFNSANQTTVSGTTTALAEFAEFARRRSVTAVALNVSHGFHSWAMNDALGPFEEILKDVSIGPAKSEAISTVTGGKLSVSADVRSLLLRQLTAPVLYMSALRQMSAAVDLLVECGPGKILTKLATEQVSAPAVSLDVGGHLEGLARTTVALSAAGAISDLSPWLRVRSHSVPLPSSIPILISNPCGSRDPAEHPHLSRQASAPVSLSLDVETHAAKNLTHKANALPAPSDEGPRAPEVADPKISARGVYIQELSARTGLRSEQLTDELSLLRDLHLNSLQVGQIFNLAVEKIGRQQPENPLSLSDATIGQTIELLESLDDFDCAAPERAASAAPWSATYVDSWLDISDRAPWEGLHWAGRDGTETRANALFAFLERGDDYGRIADVLHGLVSSDTVHDVVAIIHDGAGSSVARSLALEYDRDTAIVSVTTQHRAEEVIAKFPVLEGQFEDLLYDGGKWFTRRAVPLRGDTLDLALTTGGLCIVTGGMTGITAECALELAKAHSVSLVFTGRSPADSERVSPKLGSLRNAGVEAHYIQCDLTEPSACERLMAEAQRFGVVRSILHGAGINTPRPLREATRAGLQTTDAIKTVAFHNLIKTCPDPAQLELVVTFGSIIGRVGLAGEAEYAIANNRLRVATEEIAVQLTETVVRHFEWTVWNSVGMGVSLSVVDDLARSGVAALSPDLGRQAFLKELCTSGPTARMVLSSFPAVPTLVFEVPQHPHARFLERTVAQTGTSELIVESDLSTATDMAVSDHRLDGIAVVPAVQSLEAIAQVVSAVTVEGEGWRFTSVRFAQPVVVEDTGHTTIRVAVAQSAALGAFHAVVRSSTDKFAQAAVECTVERLPSINAHTAVAPRAAPDIPLRHLYGSLFFHGNALQRVTAISGLSASRVLCTLTATRNVWFSQFLPSDLVLGDPGLLDASLHTLQACFPDMRLLPTSVGELRIQRPVIDETMTLEAIEKSVDDPNSMIIRFDVGISDADGIRVATWRNVDLTPVSPLSGSMVDIQLCGPYLARRIRSLTGCVAFDATVTPKSMTAADACSFMGFGTAYHSPAGRLEAQTGHVSTSSSGAWRLTAGAPDSVIGVDWMIVEDDMPFAVVAPRDCSLLEVLINRYTQREEIARIVLWTVREAVVKAGQGCEVALEIRSVHATAVSTEIEFAVPGRGAVIAHHTSIVGPNAAERTVVTGVFISAERGEEYHK